MKIFLILLLCFFNIAVYAFEGKCPSVHDIRQVNFTKAMPNPAQGGIWWLKGNIEVNQTTYSVWFGAYLPKARDLETALRFGTEYFNVQASLSDTSPDLMKNDAKMWINGCRYTSPNQQKDFVFAF
mgnify:CR=1 FL=1